MTDEVWVQCDEFPDYQISSSGSVYNTRRMRYLTPGMSSEGVLRVTLYRDGVGHIRYVHLLVARAFHPSNRGRMTWADRNRANNSATNVIEMSRIPRETRVKRPGWGKRIQIVETGMVFRTVRDCADYIHGDWSKIYACLRGTRRSHLGYTFRYHEE